MAATGAWLGGMAPYGYRKEGNQRQARLAISDEPIAGTGWSEAEVVRRIYRMAVQHWEQIVAADFFTVEVWTKRGLQRFVVLSFIELCTRRVEIAGIAAEANGLWMKQIGRNLTDAVDGILHGKRYLIHDHDPLFTEEFRNLLAGVGVESVKIPPRSPNLNAYAERFVRSIKESCLERMIWFGEDAMRQGVREFVAHYHQERNHQGLDDRLIQPEAQEFPRSGKIERRQRLGGLLNYYYRVAA